MLLCQTQWKVITGVALQGLFIQVVHDNYLGKHEDPTEIEFYMCGPPMMNKAITGMLYDLGVEDEMIDFDDFG